MIYLVYDNDTNIHEDEIRNINDPSTPGDWCEHDVRRGSKKNSQWRKCQLPIWECPLLILHSYICSFVTSCLNRFHGAKGKLHADILMMIKNTLFSSETMIRQYQFLEMCRNPAKYLDIKIFRLSDDWISPKMKWQSQHGANNPTYKAKVNN